ncbi:MAG: hypothetical protein IIU16_01345, partial [Bacteroidales bacterium]|nr:hypothetical protein [Bacteroidales bacterium]
SFWFLYDRPYQTFIPRDFQDDCWSESNPNAYGEIADSRKDLETRVKNGYLLNKVPVRKRKR